MGLEEKTLIEAIERGLAARQTCTSFHPPSFPGTFQWADTHRALRELLVREKWTPDDSHNYSRVVSPDKAVAVTVATGDEYTGIAGAMEPRTKHPKGSQTDLAIEINVQQLTFLPIAEPGASTEPRARQATWILLIATTVHEVRAELSCPSGQDEMGHVVAWSERIPLPSIEIDTIPINRGDDDDDEPPAIDVHVERI
ncbi:MAG: hypothetical protein ACLQBY_00010 [Solirubrobacteraceae bacterium]